MYQNHSKGFTLIELLVVIGIIGILSAVVLASLNTARFKGNDAAIQSDLAAIQTQSEIYYGGTGGNSYGTAGASCATAVFSDATIIKAVAGAKVANGGTDLVCNNSLIAYAVQSKMATERVAGTPDYWCVDSTGVASKSSTALLANVTVCP